MLGIESITAEDECPEQSKGRATTGGMNDRAQDLLLCTTDPGTCCEVHGTKAKQ